ncbi:hypothetical protein [Actinomadura sp. 9N215]|uniref:hypothetical protein n=1 Tax=Actinomadura sp. 9N215 TaxID=3375150 RepID=UPI0037B39818
MTIHTVIDFIHRIEKIWAGAWDLHRHGDSAAEDWVATHVLALLAGHIGQVIASPAAALLIGCHTTSLRDRPDHSERTTPASFALSARHPDRRILRRCQPSPAAVAEHQGINSTAPARATITWLGKSVSEEQPLLFGLLSHDPQGIQLGVDLQQLLGIGTTHSPARPQPR